MVVREDSGVGGAGAQHPRPAGVGCSRDSAGWRPFTFPGLVFASAKPHSEPAPRRHSRAPAPRPRRAGDSQKPRPSGAARSPRQRLRRGTGRRPLARGADAGSGEQPGSSHGRWTPPGDTVPPPWRAAAAGRAMDGKRPPPFGARAGLWRAPQASPPALDPRRPDPRPQARDRPSPRVLRSPALLASGAPPTNSGASGGRRHLGPWDIRSEGTGKGNSCGAAPEPPRRRGARPGRGLGTAPAPRRGEGRRPRGAPRACWVPKGWRDREVFENHFVTREKPHSLVLFVKEILHKRLWESEHRPPGAGGHSAVQSALRECLALSPSSGRGFALPKFWSFRVCSSHSSLDAGPLRGGVLQGVGHTGRPASPRRAAGPRQIGCGF